VAGSGVAGVGDGGIDTEVGVGGGALVVGARDSSGLGCPDDAVQATSAELIAKRLSRRTVDVLIIVVDSNPLMGNGPSLIGPGGNGTSTEREATPDEMRALGHPLRWRILRLTLATPLTNKQLAERLGRDPGTVLHHVRELVRTGFLEGEEVRSGKRGALERPYRATGKSWRVRLTPNAGTAVSIIDAVREELLEAGTEATLATLRLGVRLTPDDIDALRAALNQIGEDFARRDDPHGQAVGILAVVHRRKV
jgi:DNA-binding MarR family transcriptional regulator